MLRSLAAWTRMPVARSLVTHGNVRTRNQNPHLEDMAPSTLPPDASEVLERNMGASETMRDHLKNIGLIVHAFELRRKITTSEFVAYATLSSDIGLERLLALEEGLRLSILKLHKIEIARVYWRFHPLTN